MGATLLGRRRRDENDALRLFRAEWAAHVDARAVLANAVASIKSSVSVDLQRVEHMHLATAAAVEQLLHEVIDQEHGLTTAVEQLVQVCTAMTARIESAQLERRSLAEAVTRLTHESLPSTSPSRVLDGSVFSTPLAPNGDQILTIDDAQTNACAITAVSGDGFVSIDDGDAADRITADVNAEVWCRFEGRWVGGFEVSELVKDADVIRCRLRRNSDGYVLPALFRVDDIRPAEEDVTNPEAPRPDRWHPAR